MITLALDKPFTWQYSIDRCRELILKDEIHGHKVPYDQDDFVVSYDGFEGRVIHKEYLREDENLIDGLWYINVQSYSEIRTFTNPNELRRIDALTRR